MKIILCSLLLTMATASFSQKMDVLHYAYNVEVNDSTDVIRCSALITLRGASPVQLELAGNMKITSVWNEHTKKKLQFKHANNIVTVPAVADTGVLKIGIAYSGVPKDGLIISRNKYGQRTFFTDHWPNRAHYWLVCHDHPSDKAAIDFIVKAPARYQVVSNGIQVEETNIDSRYKLTHWREKIDLPTKVVCLGISEFAVGYAGSAAGVPVYTWVFPRDKAKGFADYAVALEVLSFFSKNIGPYPYAKLANVQSKTMFGGMENASAIFYYENSATGSGKMAELVAHEVAHQWFGNMVTEADWPHVWLSEGFATCMELIFLEHKYGTDTLRKVLALNREKVIEFYRTVKTPIVDTTQKDYMNLLNTNSYEKAGWVLHMLRRQVGDSVFWKGVRKYYSTYAGGNAVTEDFRRVIENMSGQDLSGFFKQWLYTGGHPVLKVTKKFDALKKEMVITIKQQQAEVFSFPLTVKVGSVFKTVSINEKETVFRVASSSASAVVLDPECDLLFE